jgi:hypothetical protein
MLHPEILQFLVILLTVLARKGYYELFRSRITNVWTLNFADRVVAVPAFVLGIWAFVELCGQVQFQLNLPSVELLLALRIWLITCSLIPAGVILVGWVWRWRLSNFLIGLGRSCLTFGLPIGFLPWIWFGGLG